MAIMKAGPLGQVSGRLGGVEFALRGGKSVVKQCKVKRSRVSSRTYAAQGNQAAALLHWQSLTDSQRLAWETVAAQKPIPDRFGVSRLRTGRELFLTIPHDFRYGVTETWQDVPPSRVAELLSDPAIITLTTTILTVQLQVSTPPPNWVAAAWFARFTKSYLRQHRGWFKGGLVQFNKSLEDADFTYSMAQNDVVFLSGEQVALKVQFWHEDFWPFWWDFGVVTVP